MAGRTRPRPPVLDLRHLLDWDDGQRWAVLSALKALHPWCLARSGASSPPLADIFAVVLALLAGPDDLIRSGRGRRAAVEAAVLFHADALEAACSQIVARLKALGVKGVLPQTLLKEARNVAGLVEQAGQAPESAARSFMASLAKGGWPASGIRPLAYYRHEFYEHRVPSQPWLKGRWRRLDHKDLRARVAGFLQQGERAERVTQRYVSDVLANLEGLAHLDAWAEDMPFMIQPGGDRPSVSRPRLIVFKDRMIDLDEAIAYLGAASEGEAPLPTRYDIVPEYFTTQRLPFVHIPDADCPLWEGTLDRLLPRRGKDDRRREVLQEFMGWTLLAGDLSYQRFLVLVGAGSNGKSTILDAWEALLGRDNVSHVPLSQLDGEFRLCEMTGKMANIAGDMPRLEKVEEGVLKQLTSGDRIQVNRKHLPPVTMRPTAKLVFGTNALPPFADRSDGVWRRLIALPFLEQIPPEEVDPRRAERLMEELPGIFNWALAGAARLSTPFRKSFGSGLGERHGWLYG
ncbi:MAG: hypothetical protein K2W96_07390 [Gemmataceae bacterium]|nr:hypothetical protein [Gemmataceae bacterium]